MAITRAYILPYTTQITDKIVSDVTLGRALVLDVRFIRASLGLRASPLGIVDEPKYRIVHDLTLRLLRYVPASMRILIVGRAPECVLGHVLFGV